MPEAHRAYSTSSPAAKGRAPFQFEGAQIRNVILDGEPWFVGRDVCKALGLENESQALSRLDADERDGVTIVDPMGRSQTVTIISEAGVYRLIFTSRVPKAEAFKRWLAHEVLPAIRRTGSYGVQEPVLGDLSRYTDLQVILLKTLARMGGSATRSAITQRAGQQFRDIGQMEAVLRDLADLGAVQITEFPRTNDKRNSRRTPLITLTQEPVKAAPDPRRAVPALTVAPRGEAPPPPVQPSSSVPMLKEMLLVIRSAMLRECHGEAPDFATALEGTVVDLLTIHKAPPATGSAYTNGSIWIGD